MHGCNQRPQEGTGAAQGQQGPGSQQQQQQPQQLPQPPQAPEPPWRQPAHDSCTGEAPKPLGVKTVSTYVSSAWEIRRQIASAEEKEALSLKDRRKEKARHQRIREMNQDMRTIPKGQEKEQPQPKLQPQLQPPPPPPLPPQQRQQRS